MTDAGMRDTCYDALPDSAPLPKRVEYVQMCLDRRDEAFLSEPRLRRPRRHPPLTIVERRLLSKKVGLYAQPRAVVGGYRAFPNILLLTASNSGFDRMLSNWECQASNLGFKWVVAPSPHTNAKGRFCCNVDRRELDSVAPHA